MRLVALISLVGAFALAQPVLAEPPADARPLSEIVTALEDADDVSHFDEIEWDDDGYWEIEYVRGDGSRVEVKIDPVSGEPRR